MATLILATGYRPELHYLAGTGVLDAAGALLHDGGVSRTTVCGMRNV